MVEQMAYNQEMGEKRSEFSYGSGCKSCANTGYQGRTGIFEIFSMSDDMRMKLLNGNTAAELRNQAVEEKMVSLLRDGMLKVKAGITTTSEVLRNAYASDQ